MNAASWIVLGVVLAAAAVALGFIVHRKRRYGSASCSGCALKGVCSDAASTKLFK